MDFLPVATPRTESELAVMISLLDANGISHFVHNRGFGGLYPGLQIELYNVRRLMVPADQAAQAFDLLSVFSPRAVASGIEEKLTLGDRLRVVVETLLFAWSFPTRRTRLQTGEDDER